MKAIELLMQQLQLQGNKPLVIAPAADIKSNKRTLDATGPEKAPPSKVSKTNPATRLNTSRSFKMFCIFP